MELTAALGLAAVPSAILEAAVSAPINVATALPVFGRVRVISHMSIGGITVQYTPIIIPAWSAWEVIFGENCVSLKIGGSIVFSFALNPCAPLVFNVSWQEYDDMDTVEAKYGQSSIQLAS